MGVKPGEEKKPGDVQRFVTHLRDEHLQSQTILELAQGYQAYRATNKSWVEIVPDPEAPLERSLLLVMARKLGTVEEEGKFIAAAVQAAGVSIPEDGRYVDEFYDEEETAMVAAIPLARPLTAVQHLEVSEKVRSELLAQTERRRLSEFLHERNRSPEEIERLTRLYLDYLKNGVNFTLQEVPEEGLSYLSVILRPYERPKGLPEPNARIEIGRYAEAAQRNIEAQRLFVSEFRQTPDSSPVAFIQVAFPTELISDTDLNLVGLVLTTLRPYVGGAWQPVSLEAGPVALPAALPRPVVLPQPLRAHRKAVEDLIRGFKKDQTVRLADPIPGPEEGQATLMIVGSRKQAGVLEALLGALETAGIPLTAEVGIHPSDDVGVAYAVIEADISELKRIRQAGERGSGGSVLGQIQQRIEARFPSEGEVKLLAQLSGRFGSDDPYRVAIDWMAQQYRQYHGMPRVDVQEIEREGVRTAAIVGIAPYFPPLPADIDRRFIRGIEKVAGGRIGESPLLTQETEKLHPVVLVLLTFDLSANEVMTLGIDSAVEEVLSGLSSTEPQAGPSTPPSGSLRAGLEEQRSGIADAVREEIRARGWADLGNGFARTGQGGYVAVNVSPLYDVDLGRISRETVITQGSLVLGPLTETGPGARVEGSLVLNSAIRRNAVVTDSVVRTLEAEQERGGWDPGMFGHLLPPVHLTEVGPGAVVLRSDLVNVRVDSMEEKVGRTGVIDSFLKNSEVGKGNHLRRAKMTLVHTEPLVTVEGPVGVPVELAESWVGWGMRFQHRSYNEATMPNQLVWAELVNGKVKTHVVEDFPFVGVVGHDTIMASYDGTMKAKEPVLTRITGNEPSIHAWIAAQSGFIAGGPVTAIGLKHGEVASAEDLLSDPNLTLLMPFAHLKGQVWGRSFPGSLQTDLSRLSQRPLALFKDHEEAVWGLVREAWEKAKAYVELKGAEQNWTRSDKEKALNRYAEEIAQWPVRALKTAAALAAAELRQEMEKPEEKRRQELISLYEDTIQSARGPLEVGWWQIPLDQARERLERITARYEDAERLAASSDEAEVLDLWQARPLWREEDEQFLRDGVPLTGVERSAEVDPTALLLGSAVTGKSEIGRGVIAVGSFVSYTHVAGLSEEAYQQGRRMILWRSRVAHTEVGEGTTLSMVVAEGSSIGKGSDVRISRLETSALGPRSWGTQAVLESTEMGDRAEVEAFTRLANTEAGRHVIVGGIGEDNVLGDGFTWHHTGAMAFGLSARDMVIPGTSARVANTSNLSDGARAGLPGGGPKQVIFEGPVMVAANSRLLLPGGKGFPLVIGPYAFVKGVTPAYTDIAPFQFYDGAKPEELQFVFDKIPGMLFRLGLSKQLKETQENNKEALAEAIARVLERGVNSFPGHIREGWGEALQKRYAAELASGNWDLQYDPQTKSLGFTRVEWRWEGDKEGLNGKYVPRPRTQAGLEERQATATSADFAVTLTATGAPIQTVSELKAELTLVPGSAPAKQTAGIAFVVTPEGLPKFAAAAVVFGATGVRADLIARDARHQASVQEHLAALGFDMAQVTVHNAEEEWHGNVGEALVDLKLKHLRNGRGVQEVTGSTGLAEIARFLGAPVAEAVIRSLEAVADRSNQIWL
ncbi:MAG: hypothetical protein HYZ90_03085 [Candidatus Omnitrophica bacterium]|nr:hypothetical protein [Candidatus Omnitrophota bacterium]